GGTGADGASSGGRAPEHETEPSLLLLIGDQVYADELQPSMQEFLARRRSHPGSKAAGQDPPPDEVVSFDEYAELYRQAWSDPDIRWLLSTVPTLMLFDDHDIRDDWNTSGTWREQMARTPWWRPRITSGLGAYWVYQHLGNLSPDHRAADPVFAEVSRTSPAATAAPWAAPAQERGTAVTTERGVGPDGGGA
ncbi:alkaline phosphatase D family protein, partial [Streptomonospora algeriensis]